MSRGRGAEARLLELRADLLHEVEALRTEVASLRGRVETVEGRVSWRRGVGEALDVEEVGVGDEGEQHRPVVRAPRRVFPKLITETEQPSEEQVYGAAAEFVVEWREAWTARRKAPYILDWLRAERRRLELEQRLIGEFGLTPHNAIRFFATCSRSWRSFIAANEARGLACEQLSFTQKPTAF